MWGATVYLPPNTVFQYKFIRKEKNGNVCPSRPHSGLECETGRYLHVGWVDRVGIGSEQGRYDPGVRSAVDFDDLALKRSRIICGSVSCFDFS